MSVEWIKLQKSTPSKIEIARIAALLGIPRSHATGLCVVFWIWCDSQLSDSHADGVTESMIDEEVRHVGFAEAMVKVGWLVKDGESIVIPNFERHLSQSAKRRGLESEKKRTQRERTAERPPSCPQKTGTFSGQVGDQRREEKNKEDKKPSSSSSKDSSAREVPPETDEWTTATTTILQICRNQDRARNALNAFRGRGMTPDEFTFLIDEWRRRERAYASKNEDGDAVGVLIWVLENATPIHRPKLLSVFPALPKGAKADPAPAKPATPNPADERLKVLQLELGPELEAMSIDAIEKRWSLPPPIVDPVRKRGCKTYRDTDRFPSLRLTLLEAIKGDKW